VVTREVNRRARQYAVLVAGSVMRGHTSIGLRRRRIADSHPREMMMVGDDEMVRGERASAAARRVSSVTHTSPGRVGSAALIMEHR